MEIKYQLNNNHKSGFALLMSLIVVSVVLSIGVAILELSLKQVQLSTNARESERAFHAANAGMECSRYWRRNQADAMERGQSFSPTCFDNSGGTVNATTLQSELGGDVFQYEYNFTWGLNGSRCTVVNTIVASSTLPGPGLTITNLDTLIPGFPDGNSKSCIAGERCTIIAVKGYNRPCSTIGAYGTVEREVLLQF